MSPSSSVEPNRCFNARSMRSAWWRSPSNDKHGVDDVLERARPGERAVLGDVADEQRRDAGRPSRAARSRCAASRTCATDPAAPGASGSWTVWIESIASTSGASVFDVRAHRGQRGLVRRGTAPECERAEPVGAQPHLRRRLLARSRAGTGRPSAAIAPSAWSSSVLLPMPGSPPMSVTEPATRPPSSTRSSSDSPVGRRGAAAGSTSASGTGVDVSERARGRRRPPRPAPRRSCPTRRSPVQRPSHWRRLVAALRTPIANTCSGHGGSVHAAMRQPRGLRANVPSTGPEPFKRPGHISGVRSTGGHSHPPRRGGGVPGGRRCSPRGRATRRGRRGSRRSRTR